MVFQRAKDSIILSDCGSYIVRSIHDVGQLEVFEIRKNLAQQIKQVDLKQVIAKHLQEVGLEETPYLNDIVMEELRWEKVKGMKKSSKFGVVVKALSIVVILHVEDNIEPIIIQQSQADGVSHFEWIPPVQDEKEGEEEEGAYKNSKQLLLFTRNCVQAKLFSLDCTQVLFTMDKPKRGSILVRPRLGNAMWSMVTEARSHERGEQLCTIYHFLNRGSISSNFYKFKIPESVADMESEMRWSESGKWLSCFDYVGTLFGFLLQVFNSLGWYRNRRSNTGMPVGDPIIDIGYLVNGISDYPRKNSLVSVGSNEYLLQWIQDQRSKAEFVLVAGMQTMEEAVYVEILVMSIEHFGLIHRVLLPEIPTIHVWQRSLTDYRNIFHYNRSFKSSFKLKRNSKIRYFESYNDKGSWLALHVEDMLFIYEIIYGDDERLLTFNLAGAIHLDSRILSLKFFSGFGENVKLLVALSSHIFVFDTTAASIEVIHTLNGPRLLRDSQVFIGTHFVRLVARADAAPPSDWVIIDYNSASPETQEPTISSQSVARGILSRHLLQDLRNTLKRASDNRLGRLDSSTFEEVTDTFNIQKKAKH